MHRYIPHTEEEIKQMLAEIGVSSIDDLFVDVPKTIDGYKIPESKDEFTVRKAVQGLARMNVEFEPENVFLGAGIYFHHIPTVVGHLASNPNFLTAYTPYQAEVSQGTLQMLFEFQTMMCELTGMQVSNSSMYDGASAFAEALLMAARINGKKKMLVAKTINPEYRTVARTYTKPAGITIDEINYNRSGRIDVEMLRSKIDDDTSAVAVAYPNFFGIVEDLKSLRELIPENIVFIVVAEPVSLAILEAPGKFGADIVVGEGQSLGVTPNLGGPGIGFFTTLEKHVRKMPGRIIGQTKDVDGKTGYVMILQTREQHIRREKATSNICSNQAYIALLNALYLSVMGPQGLKEVAWRSYNSAHYLADELAKRGFKRVFDGEFFNEFVVEVPISYREKWHEMVKNGILGPIPIDRVYRELGPSALVCTTEVNTKESMQRLIEVMTK
ncbi:MAG TPA: aminomethyl-transferring glycine dehydrogenase subunit GcvPA [Fervidobacterium sp.]|nr:aminomethyl-transferring glycine dehydrogenase subunit GcvPA [Fervidobacterium sp.]HQE49651.1 aminomethyl-transferring glycine dehydrogenase subunit GcvPA [Fervidobacterium sp.]HUM43607.1 aminomethyl-transferring glycine dehydrogenase subunit GcvPA [Fervidobacterium sp.]